jgi:hypothetical protein
MSGVSLPVSRPVGRALIVGSPTNRTLPLSTLQRLGFTCAETDDPYGAMLELCRRPLVYRAVILSLASLYREELQIIATIKRRMPHVEIWLTHIEARQASLAEAMRLGADGLLAEDGLHRTGVGGALSETVTGPRPALPATPATEAEPPPTFAEAPAPAPSQDEDSDSTIGEPVLTADELRALLQEQPSGPPSGDDR